MFISKRITSNIKHSKITKYLKGKGITPEEGDKGMEFHLWLGKLSNDQKITEDLNECIYKELMYGYRRMFRYYELNKVRTIKREVDWNNFLRAYDCPNMNFNRIIQTDVTLEEKVKVAAINCLERDGVIQKVDIIFVFNMKLNRKGADNTEYTNSYLPVSFDLENKTLIIKVWNKEEGAEENTPADQLNTIFDSLMEILNFSIHAISKDPQKVLYNMSKDLFDDFFMQLPNITEIESKKESLDEIINKFLSGITLSNVINVDGNFVMNTEVMDIKEEMYKLLQQVALFDYLKDNRLECLLENTDKYISRIKFNDRDNLSASLISETGSRCIFDTKTFMCVRNSLDLVENIVAIVVSFVKDRGLLSVKYDASDKNYLSIHILKNRYFEEEDYNQIWELYSRYESENNAENGTVHYEDNAQAM